jgi:hypothetical protein
MKTIFTFFVFLLFSISISAQEDILYQVVPSDYTSVPGTGSFLGPLYTGARTYQLLIHEDLLTALIGQEIQSLSWRIPPSAASNWPPIDATVPNYDLYLSGSVTPANRSLTDFSMNVVGPQKQVRSGSLFIPMNSYPSGSSPNDWGPEIIFDSLYLYTGGHLLVELRLTGTGTTNQSTDALTTSTTGYGTLFSACWGSSYTANSGSQGNFSIVRLTADDPVPVELTSFTASANSNNVLLEWTTATEINNYGFEVERKAENSGYEVVGFVTGSGTTTEQRSYIFTDAKVPDGKYLYRLKQTDFDGSFNFSHEVEVEVIAPAVFALEQNYPNPFNPSTNINFSIAEASVVKIAVYNLLGQEVAELVNEFKAVGLHTVNFDASEFPSGAYFYSIETPQFRQTRKMLLTK